MKRVISLLICLESACCIMLHGATPGEKVTDKPGKQAPVDQQKKEEALKTVEKLLKGNTVSDLDLKNLDKAVIRIETAAPSTGIDAPKGVEGENKTQPKNVYILRFDTGADNEQQLQTLNIQKQILRNQLMLLKSLQTIASYQVILGTRTARVENSIRDMTLGMKASSTEMHKVRGDTAGTNAKVTDIAGTTADMSQTMNKMSKDVSEIEGSIDNVDMMIGKISDKFDSDSFDRDQAMKKNQKAIEARFEDVEDK